MPYNSFADYPMSWKPVLDRNSRPLYLALARQLANDVINGILLPGTKLPISLISMLAPYPVPSGSVRIKGC